VNILTILHFINEEKSTDTIELLKIVLDSKKVQKKINLMVIMISNKTLVFQKLCI